MNTRCLTDEELGELLDPGGDDARRDHLATCPRCDARLMQLRDFLAAEPGVEGARLRDARGWLDRALAEELGTSATARPAPDIMTRSWLDRILPWLQARSLRPVVAALVLVIVAGGAWLVVPRRPTSSPRLRGDVPTMPLALAAPRALGNGVLELSWTPMVGADRYEVVLIAPDLTLLASIPTVPVAYAVLRRPDLPPGIKPGMLVSWQVLALLGRDTLGVSAIAPIRLP